MIEKISNFLAGKLSANLSTDSSYSDTEVLQYGIECIINITIPLIVIFVYSLFQHSCIEMIIWSFSFLLLRNYLGGYHAPTHISCLIISCIYGIVSISLINVLAKLALKNMVVIGLIFILINFITNLPLHNNEDSSKITCFFTSKFFVLFFLLLFIIIFNYISAKFSSAILTGICAAELLYFIGLLTKYIKLEK